MGWSTFFLRCSWLLAILPLGIVAPAPAQDVAARTAQLTFQTSTEATHPWELELWFRFGQAETQRFRASGLQMRVPVLLGTRQASMLVTHHLRAAPGWTGTRVPLGVDLSGVTFADSRTMQGRLQSRVEAYPSTTTPENVSAAEEFGLLLGLLAAEFPEGPITLGQQWQNPDAGVWPARRIGIRFERRYRLVEISSDSATIEWEIDVYAPRVSLSGGRRLEGRGTLRGRQIVQRNDPSVGSLTLEGEIDFRRVNATDATPFITLAVGGHQTVGRPPPADTRRARKL